MAGAPLALLCHTLSHTAIFEIRLNGIRVGEVGLWAAIAGEFNVPLAMVAGDAAAVEEAKRLLGDVEGVAVKRATSMYAAECIHPSITRKMIAEAAEKAVRKCTRGLVKPFRLEKPVRMDVVYTLPSIAERVKRINGRTVSYMGGSVIECMSVLL